MMEFENKQLFSDNLPEIERLIPEQLEKNYLKVLYIVRTIVSLILLVCLFVSRLFLKDHISDNYFLLALVLLLLIIVLMLILTPRVFSMKAYALRQKDLYYRTGLIVRKSTIVPFERVQHVEIKNGPVDRMFGLSRLNIFTAGGSQSDLSIPGLNPEKARQIKELIVLKKSSDEEE